jgi:hypothetical protein
VRHLPSPSGASLREWPAESKWAADFVGILIHNLPKAAIARILGTTKNNLNNFIKACNKQ